MSVCDHRRYIALGVKSKDTMWIMCMPHYNGAYSNLGNPSSIFHYGERTSYAPYQVFFKEPPAAEKDTTFLAVQRKGYRLSEIMDEMQKIWLPVFLEETVDRFFNNQPEAEDIFLPEEISANGGSYSIIPLQNSLLAETKLAFDVPTPESVFSEDAATLTLITHYRITKEDIKEYPILPKEMGSEEELNEIFLSYVKMAYEAEIKNHAKKSLEEKERLRNDITNSLFSDNTGIIERAKAGKFKSFAKELVDGTVTEREQWSGQIKKTMYHPSKYDYTEHPKSSYISSFMHPYIFWNGQKAKKPGVILEIRPKTSDDYATLLGCSKKELPEVLRYYDELQKYVGRTGIPNFMDINICMTKRTYKKDFARKAI